MGSYPTAAACSCKDEAEEGPQEMRLEATPDGPVHTPLVPLEPAESSPEAVQSLLIGTGTLAVATPAPVKPQRAPPAERRRTPWERLGGEELEEPINEGWVRVLKSDYLTRLVGDRGVLKRRQDIPDDAYVTLPELQQSQLGECMVEELPEHEVKHEWLPIIVISYPWLQPSHPDPFGETLEVVAKACGIFPPDHGVVIDFTALHQPPRSEVEEDAFQKGLKSLSLFYSHPHTIVFQATAVPEGYPAGKHKYDLPAGENRGAYGERGWCFAESAMSALVKESTLLWDLSRLPSSRTRGDAEEEAAEEEAAEGDGWSLPALVQACKTARVAPLEPEDFSKRLATKTFAEPNSDRQKVEMLYEAAFKARIERAESLDFAGLEWGPSEVQTLVKGLRSNSSLRTLDLSDNRIGEDGACALADLLRGDTVLQHLRLNTSLIGDAGACALAEGLRVNSVLQNLSLQHCQVRPKGALALAGALRDNTSLLELNLYRNTVGAEGARALAASLANSGMQKLNLGGNSVGQLGRWWQGWTNGMPALAAALRESRTLLDLCLDDSEIKAEGAQLLAAAVRGNNSLQRLDLSRNNLGDEGAQSLGKALRDNAVLRELVLAFCWIGHVGARALAEALRSNTALQVLDLSNPWHNGGNKVSTAGARALGDALRSNAVLLELGLEYNHIGDDGVLVLAEALRGGCALQKLKLCSNPFGDDGARALAKALSSKAALRVLSLQDCSIRDAGARALAEAVRSNEALQELDLRFSSDLPSFSGEGARALAEAWRRSSTLQKLHLNGHPNLA